MLILPSYMINRRASQAAVSPSPLLTDLVAGWKLDEASGTRSDIVGSSHLTDVNTVTSSAGKTGDAALFTRANAERLYVATNAALQMGDIDFAISFWMKVSGSASTPAGIINKWYDNSQREYCIYIGIAGAKISWIVRNAVHTADVQLNEAGTVTTETWYHYVCYHDSVNNRLGIVRNAGTPTTVAHSGGVYPGTANPRELAIGCDQNLPNLGNNSYFNGNIEDVYIWKRMLTTEEIAALYNHGNGLAHPFVSPMLTLAQADFYYKLDEVSGTRADSGPNGLSLTDVNTVTRATGKLTDAAVFASANNEKLSGGISNASAVTGDFSMGCWVYLTSKAGTTNGLLSKWNTGGDYILSFENGTDRFRYYQSAVALTANSFGSPSLNTWYFVVVTRSGATTKISVNAGTQDSTTISGNPGASRYFAIGGLDENGYSVNGRIDQAFKFPFALTQTEIEWLYNSGNGRELT